MTRDKPHELSDFEIIDLSQYTLEEFRPRATRWANSFDQEFCTILYCLSQLTNLRTAEARVSQAKLQERIVDAYRRQNKETRAPSTRTIQRRLRVLRDNGLVNTYQPRTAQEWSQKPAFRTNRYQFNFLATLTGGGIVAHDFAAPISPKPKLADSMALGKSDRLANVPSPSVIQPSASTIAANGFASNARPEPSLKGQNGRRAEWLRLCSAQLSDLLGGPVGIAGLSKHFDEFTDLDFGQQFSPLLETWIFQNWDRIQASYSPVGFVLSVFPEEAESHEQLIASIWDEVERQGRASGLLEFDGASYQLLDYDGTVAEEFSEDEFQYLLDDPANGEWLLNYFRKQVDAREE